MPGRVWLSGEPAWIAHVGADPNFPRGPAAAAAGLHTAFCFPIRSAGTIVGAMEFFARVAIEPNEALLTSMAILGSQIGQFVVRRQAEDAVRESEARNRAILDSALDAVITMDHRGYVLAFNHAAERIFGYAAAEAVGRDMADLIVPPSLRPDHRRGIARYLETEEAVILDRRLEITGMHADGSEFPVELTITRIGLAGSPTFTGYVRDITDRVQAEAELKASRARIVEAGDNERRRLERNLHDGAQQHLVSLALRLRDAATSLAEDPERARRQLEQADLELAIALDELRELARGIHPAVLGERGLRPALEGLADRVPLSVTIAELPVARLPDPIEVAAYYFVAEALTNVVKYAHASHATVRISEAGGLALLEVSDDGVGGATLDGVGSGLGGLADRVEALGGTLVLESPPGAGSRLRAAMPFTRS